jgi:MYXO-CTERM domain-containing protein
MVLFSVPAAVFADAIEPPTSIECPAGSEAETNHCGTVCAARTCEGDGDCESGERCTERPLCIEELACGGFGALHTIVHAACEGGSCAQGTCRTVRTCGRSDGSGGDGDAGDRYHVTYGCGCSTAGRGGSPFVVLLAIGGVVLALRRRT